MSRDGPSFLNPHLPVALYSLTHLDPALLFTQGTICTLFLLPHRGVRIEEHQPAFIPDGLTGGGIDRGFQGGPPGMGWCNDNRGSREGVEVIKEYREHCQGMREIVV